MLRTLLPAEVDQCITALPSFGSLKKLGNARDSESSFHEGNKTLQAVPTLVAGQ